MLETDTRAGQFSNGLAHLTSELQAVGRTKRALYLSLNLGGSG